MTAQASPSSHSRKLCKCSRLFRNQPKKTGFCNQIKTLCQLISEIWTKCKQCEYVVRILRRWSLLGNYGHFMPCLWLYWANPTAYPRNLHVSPGQQSCQHLSLQPKCPRVQRNSGRVTASNFTIIVLWLFFSSASSLPHVLGRQPLHCHCWW